MANMIKKAALALCFLAMLTYSCKHEVLVKPAPIGTVPVPVTPNNPVVISTCSADTVYFWQSVLPILVSNCAVPGCHDAGSQIEGYVFTDYVNVMKIVRPGRPSNS